MRTLSHAVTFILICSIWAFNPAKSQPTAAEKHVYDKKAIDLNNRAMKLADKGLLKSKPDSLKCEEAIALLDSAIAQDSTYTVPYTNKATILSALQRKAEAVATISKLVSLRPDFAEGFGLLGMLNECMGKKAEAIDWYRKSLHLYQTRFDRTHNPSARREQIEMYMMLGDSVAADSVFNLMRLALPKEDKDVREVEGFMSTFDRMAVLRDICK
jgi:tetratricopeptide (TPR) repeat protein